MNRYLLGAIGFLVIVGLGPLSTRSTGEESLRVVPQLAWPRKGIPSPDGSLFATCAASKPYICQSVKLVSKQGDLLWILPLSCPTDVSFSPDGKWLAACGDTEGFLLDLKTYNLRRFPDFRGGLVAFTPDSQEVLIVRRERRHGLGDATDSEKEGLFVYDLNARRLARLPVDMDVPQRLEVLVDGKTVQVHGGHGDPTMHVLMMGEAKETLHLDTGKIERDWLPARRGVFVHVEDPRQTALPCADTTKMLHKGPKGLWYNETSGLCVQYGSGPPTAAFAWDIRRGRFLGVCGEGIAHTMRGFVGPDTMLAAVVSGRESGASLVNVRTGQVSYTSAVGMPVCAAPDGTSFLVYAGPRTKQGRCLELYSLTTDQPVHTEEAGAFSIWSSAWSRDGRYVACARLRGPGVRVVCVADGKADDISLADVVERHEPKRDASLFNVWGLAFDDTGRRLAVGMGGMETSDFFGLVAIVNCETRNVETILDDFPIWVKAIQFAGSDLLTGTRHGRAQLWDLSQRKPLWTTETKRELIQFRYISGSPYVVCGHECRSGTVLRLKDGEAIYRTSLLLDSDNMMPFPWTWAQPQLIGRGTWSLETDPELMQIQLVDVVTGHVALCHCARANGQWIIYTPDGDWDGSQDVHDWVQFYDGLRRLSPSEAEQRHRRGQIDAILNQVFSEDGPASR